MNGRWSFDDHDIGWLPRGASALATRPIDRPAGMTRQAWYDHAVEVCALLERARTPNARVAAEA